MFQNITRKNIDKLVMLSADGYGMGIKIALYIKKLFWNFLFRKFPGLYKK